MKCVSYRSQHLHNTVIIIIIIFDSFWQVHLRQHLSTSSIVLSIVIANIVSVDQKAKRNN